jgi:hypothetical protein
MRKDARRWVGVGIFALLFGLALPARSLGYP